MHWVETHGFECLIVCFFFALVTSVMPPLPVGKGFWITWGYNVIQLAGANAGNLVKHTPMGQNIEALVSDKTKTNDDGSTEHAHLEVTSTIPKT